VGLGLEDRLVLVLLAGLHQGLLGKELRVVRGLLLDRAAGAEHVVTNDDLAKMFNTSDEWIVQRSGIRERRYIEHDGIGASDLAKNSPPRRWPARGRGRLRLARPGLTIDA
jgi:hypothetical protein